MPRVALEIEFDGAQFAGSQMQHGLRTVQGELTTVLGDIAGEAVVVRPASRLDAGVSAEALPADVLMPHLPGTGAQLRNLGQAVAGRLPADLSVRRVALVDERWNAQYAAVHKTYRYRVTVRGTKPVLTTRCWWIKRLDHPDLLQTLADQLIGTKDLRRFANLRHDGSDDDERVREITTARWENDGEHRILHIGGTGFLYKQIRGFVGAMVHVAQGRRPVSDFAALVAGDTTVRRLGNIAPPEGLVLERVTYDPEPEWIWV
jgi:tRNA pseudouridine38-40 synthase